MSKMDRLLEGPRGPWQERLAFIIDMAREMSAESDPQKMVQNYAKRMSQIMPTDGFVALSRRNLSSPEVRVTRASIWGSAVNPWKEKENLTIHAGGLFSELIYGDQPVIIDELEIAPNDPARMFVEGMRSLQAIPLFDKGTALNMVVSMRKDANAFNRETLPERVWISNLFGRATHNLVLSDQLKRAYDQLDREFKIVGDIQRSLLPSHLPHIPGLQMAVHYQTSERAGGDYYDFFPLPGPNGEPAGGPKGRWGILIADVSGHGTPAAVLMAVTHSIAHTRDDPSALPSDVMSFVNAHLARRYTNGNGKFVTAFYGIYDPIQREMTYACAGHCPPRVRRANGEIESSIWASGLPLGIISDEIYPNGSARFEPGDLLVLYTDGITEARSANAEMYGTDRLDQSLSRCPNHAGEALGCLLENLGDFAGLRSPDDDQTLLVVVFQ